LVKLVREQSMQIHQNAQFDSGEVDVTASEEGRKGIIPTHQQYGSDPICTKRAESVCGTITPYNTAWSKYAS